MNGELAQAAALAAHARAALARGEGFWLDLSHVTFQFVHAVAFDEDPRGAAPGAGAPWRGASPGEWYEHLVRGGTRDVALVIRPAGGALADHRASAFSGGGGWVIHAAQAAGGVAWPARWSVTHPQAPDRRIWSVAYRGFADAEPPPAGATLPDARRRLAAVLAEAESFSRENRLEPWQGIFADARRSLDENRGDSKNHPGLLPAAFYTSEARGLLAACQGAWVFGGMGSWNDLGFEGDETQGRYDAISAELHAAVLDGVAAAVNASNG